MTPYFFFTTLYSAITFVTGVMVGAVITAAYRIYQEKKIGYQSNGFCIDIDSLTHLSKEQRLQIFNCSSQQQVNNLLQQWQKK